RIAKKLCRARATDSILGNVFEVSTAGAAEATIRFQVGDFDVEEVVWRDGEASPDATSRISVFDSHSAALYVDQENRIEFLPESIAVVGPRRHRWTRPGEALTRGLADRSQRGQGAPPEYPHGTAAASIIKNLTASTHRDEVPTLESVELSGVWDE